MTDSTNKESASAVHPAADRFKGRTVFIGVPALFNIDPHFHKCLVEAWGVLASGKAGFHGQLRHTWGDSPVGRSRNQLTQAFLESDCTDLMFIDSDLVFSIDQIARLVESDEEIVAGIYFKKMEGQPSPVINQWHELEEKGDLMRVKYAGTGFLRIRRSVFEKMIAKYGDEIGYWPDGCPDLNKREYDFWRMGVCKTINPPRWLSEDWWFCQMAADLGIPVWVDRKILAKHSGNAIYPLSYQMDAIYGSPTPYNGGLQDVLKGEYDIPGIEPKTILDIGANEGAFTEWAKQKWPYAKVTAYEPIPNNAAKFAKNHQGKDGVELVNKAVTTKPSAKMYLGKNNSGECSIYDLGEQTSEVVDVETIHPESIGTADFVKVDTEGCEVEILSEMDLTPVKAVACEYHRDIDIPVIEAICRSAGLDLWELKRLGNQRGVLKFKRFCGDAS